MAAEQRRPLYRELEALRGHPVIAYVTSARAGAAGSIAGVSVAELLLQLDQLPSSTKELDLLLVSNGGDPTVAWRIVSLIRERVSRFSVLIPQAAFSAATLIALGADEIVMHPHGNLGPTDPQITHRKPPSKDGAGQAVGFGAEDLAAFLRFAKDNVGLTDQKQLLSVFNHFCEEVGSVAIGVAARSTQLTVSMGEKLLQLHMRADADKAKARAISEKLTRDFFHHGYPVSRSEAAVIGLPIADRNHAVERLMWAIWSSMSEELKLREPVNDMGMIFANPNAAPLFGSLPHFVVPAPNGGQAVAAQPPIIEVPPTEFELTHALMESARLATSFVTNGLLFASRLPDQNYRLSKIIKQQGWITANMVAEPRIAPIVPRVTRSVRRSVAKGAK